jgi:hypothetical protein
MRQPAYLSITKEIPVVNRQLPRVEYTCKCCFATGIVFAWEWAEDPQKCPKNCAQSKEFIAEEKRQAAAASTRERRKRLTPKPIDRELVKILVCNQGYTLNQCAESLGVGKGRMGVVLAQLRESDPEVQAAFTRNLKFHQSRGGQIAGKYGTFAGHPRECL